MINFKDFPSLNELKELLPVKFPDENQAIGLAGGCSYKMEDSAYNVVIKSISKAIYYYEKGFPIIDEKTKRVLILILAIAIPVIVIIGCIVGNIIAGVTALSITFSAISIISSWVIMLCIIYLLKTGGRKQRLKYQIKDLIEIFKKLYDKDEEIRKKAWKSFENSSRDRNLFCFDIKMPKQLIYLCVKFHIRAKEKKIDHNFNIRKLFDVVSSVNRDKGANIEKFNELKNEEGVLKKFEEAIDLLAEIHTEDKSYMERKLLNYLNLFFNKQDEKDSVLIYNMMSKVFVL
jgi:hypothetical protein